MRSEIDGDQYSQTVKSVTFPEFVWIWTESQGQHMPRLHLKISRWLEDNWRNGERQQLLMAFRSSGKSTLVGLFSAWLLLQNPCLRILVLAADFALAKKMVRNVKRIIERHPFTQGMKPERADQWASDQFTVVRPQELRDPSMLARGLSANITGSRADVIICDDVEVPNTCATAMQREELRTKLSEIEYVLVPGGLTLYVGTPHTFYTIYAEQPVAETGETRPFLAGFKRLSLPIINKKGQSAWPERFSDEDIARIRRRTGPNKFESQMMLRPVNVMEGRLDPALLKFYNDEIDYREAHRRAVLNIGERRMVAASCWWDPAYGARADGKGDGSVIAAVFADDEGDLWLHRVEYLKADAQEVTDAATQQCRRVAEFLRDLHLPAIALETNGLGKFLPGLLRQELRKTGVASSVIEVASRTPKATRIIEAFDALLAAGRLYVHRSVQATPFVREMREWRPSASTCSDDGLDAVAGALSLTPVRFASAGQPAEKGKEWRFGES